MVIFSNFGNYFVCFVVAICGLVHDIETIHCLHVCKLLATSGHIS